MKTKVERKHCPWWLDLIGFLLFAAGISLLAAVLWEIETLNVGIAEIIFTLTSPLDGADSGIARGALRQCLPGVLILCALYGSYLIYLRKFNRLHFTIRIRAWKHSCAIRSRNLFRWIAVLIPVLTWLVTCYTIERNLFFSSYIKAQLDKTTIYEDYYVRPSDVEISAKGKTKNIICLYLESMEVTYSSRETGGFQDVNLIPNLTELAYDNISFGTTPGGKLGGMETITDTGWTSAALMATTSGVPFSFPMSDPSEVGVSTSFAPNLETLGNVLQEKGYTQEFLCGSNASFGGRRTYFTGHGNYDIYDYETAISTGRLPSDYYVWWGFEDSVLYDIAKEELLRLSETGEPFNLTMLTVDTHFPDGYLCSLCEKGKYSVPLASIVECADRQAANFIQWCKEQDFYEDTVIVVMGDHPRMDTLLVSGADMADRKVYECFINADVAPDAPDPSTRLFSHMDLFPTILSAMGFQIEGDRLGLGVNLFSQQPTLVEQLGREALNAELQKTSKFYEANFY